MFSAFKFRDNSLFFFKRWQTCESSCLTSCPVEESVLQMLSSSSSSLIDAGTRFTSTNSSRWYRVLVTVFLSNWITLSTSNLLQFFVIAKSQKRNSNLLKNHPIDLMVHSVFWYVINRNKIFNEFFHRQVLQMVSCWNHY